MLPYCSLKIHILRKNFGARSQKSYTEKSPGTIPRGTSESQWIFCMEVSVAVKAVLNYFSIHEFKTLKLILVTCGCPLENKLHTMSTPKYSETSD